MKVESRRTEWNGATRTYIRTYRASRWIDMSHLGWRQTPLNHSVAKHISRHGANRHSQQCPLKYSVRNFTTAPFHSVLRIEALDSCKSNAALTELVLPSFFPVGLSHRVYEHGVAASRSRADLFSESVCLICPRVRPLHAFQFICSAFIAAVSFGVHHLQRPLFFPSSE